MAIVIRKSKIENQNGQTISRTHANRQLGRHDF